MNVHSQFETGGSAPGDATLGRRLRAIRQASGLTLKQMSRRIELPLSTLSKVERDELTLSYQQLRRILDRLNLAPADLFADTAAAVTLSGWRSIERKETVTYQQVGECEYGFPCADLRQKRMVPVLVRMRAAGARTEKLPVGGTGDQYLYVLSGAIEVTTRLYSAVVLRTGDSMYLDSRMEHAYAVAAGCAAASALLVCAEQPAPLTGPLSRSDPGAPQEDLQVPPKPSHRRLA